jgi:hypothetical protein
MTPATPSRVPAAVLYAGVAVFLVLAAFTAWAIRLAWRERSGEAKAEAVLSLVEQRMPSRPTEAPGAMAWLRLQLDEYGRRMTDVRKAALYRSLFAASERVPDAIAALAGVMRAAVPGAPDPAIGLQPQSSDSSSLRTQLVATGGGHSAVVTHRRGGGDQLDRLVRSMVPLLGRALSTMRTVLIDNPIVAVPGDRSPRPVRVYAVVEDGTLVSMPWEDTRTAVDRELALLSARPGLPSFAPGEFFFRFDPAVTRPVQSYSGFYLDLGGRGLVSTITQPLVMPDGQRAVLALDLAFEIDWRALAESAERPVVGGAVQLSPTATGSWSALDAALGPESNASLRHAVSALASRERDSGGVTDSAPLRHGLVDDAGAVTAFQVSDTTWLLMLFPRTTPAFPVAAVALSSGVLALLLAGFEHYRRRAEGERLKAERALAEKQNLLNTMQVPLVVVDPNTDVIVSANRAANAIGILAGSRFADVVWPDARSRAHYERMQVASPEPRRAYGLPVAVRTEHGETARRYAIVRSVAVTAPIAALAADERHRLGILFVLEADADLALFADELEEQAHRDERRRLAGLLSHGVETLARVLEHALARSQSTASADGFAAWLAEYLERRLTVTAWLLDHWDAVPPLAQDTVVDVEQARSTFARLTSVLEVVRADRDLRSRLHWDNGALAEPAPGGRILDVHIDWPATLEFTCPVRGGFGLFLSEVVSNAVRHGRPGTPARVDITHDAVRRELTFLVENARDRSAGPPGLEPRGEAYGGLAILRALARLFEWRDLTFRADDASFRVEWRVGVGERHLTAD